MRQIIVDANGWEAVRPDLLELAKLVRKGHALPDRDRRTLAEGVLVVTHLLPPGSLDGIKSRLRDAIRGGRADRPIAAFKTYVINDCRAAGFEFREACESLVGLDEALRTPTGSSNEPRLCTAAEAG